MDTSTKRDLVLDYLMNNFDLSEELDYADEVSRKNHYTEQVSEMDDSELNFYINEYNLA